MKNSGLAERNTTTRTSSSAASSWDSSAIARYSPRSNRLIGPLSIVTVAIPSTVATSALARPSRHRRADGGDRRRLLVRVGGEHADAEVGDAEIGDRPHLVAHLVVACRRWRSRPARRRPRGPSSSCSSAAGRRWRTPGRRARARRRRRRSPAPAACTWIRGSGRPASAAAWRIVGTVSSPSTFGPTHHVVVPSASAPVTRSICGPSAATRTTGRVAPGTSTAAVHAELLAVEGHRLPVQQRHQHLEVLAQVAHRLVERQAPHALDDDLVGQADAQAQPPAAWRPARSAPAGRASSGAAGRSAPPRCRARCPAPPGRRPPARSARRGRRSATPSTCRSRRRRPCAPRRSPPPACRR